MDLLELQKKYTYFLGNTLRLSPSILWFLDLHAIVTLGPKLPPSTLYKQIVTSNTASTSLLNFASQIY